MPTKEELQNQLDEYKALISAQQEKINKLEQDRSKPFEETPLYKDMQNTIAQEKSLLSMREHDLEEAHRKNGLLQSQIQRLAREYKLNTKILPIPTEIDKLQEELQKEQNKNKGYQERIRRLESVLYNQSDTIPVVGRKRKGDSKTDKEARRLRREGFSIREIANRTGYSIGKTQEVVASVKVTPEIKKKQEAHRREKQKKDKQ